jgi:hypothetical protein
MSSSLTRQQKARLVVESLQALSRTRVSRPCKGCKKECEWVLLHGEGYQDDNYLRQCLSCGRYFGWMYYVDQEGMERCLDWEDVNVPDWFKV